MPSIYDLVSLRAGSISETARKSRSNRKAGKILSLVLSENKPIVKPGQKIVATPENKLLYKVLHDAKTSLGLPSLMKAEPCIQRSLNIISNCLYLMASDYRHNFQVISSLYEIAFEEIFNISLLASPKTFTQKDYDTLINDIYRNARYPVLGNLPPSFIKSHLFSSCMDAVTTAKLALDTKSNKNINLTSGLYGEMNDVFF